MDQVKKSTSPAGLQPKIARPVLTKNRSDLLQASNPPPQQQNSAEETNEKTKRLPPIKAPVGLAKSPDLSNCKSKVGSLNNIKHTPTGGRVQIQSQKLNWNAKSKVGSLENREHKPAGGNIKVESRKLQWNTTSKVQSLENVKHKPGGGNVKIFNEQYRDKSVQKRPDGNNNEDTKSSSSSSATSARNETDLLTKRVQQISLTSKR